MSVIIRLQNLPWSASTMDIRQFFKGLSIPEGGVHIVGGEMGDAFIAFSTDEDARQAMMNDRGIINETQVRLLLSSRAEMQKVIETARQHSILVLRKAAASAAEKSAVQPRLVGNTTPAAVQPPIITAHSLQSILGTQLGAPPSFLAYQQQAGVTIVDKPLGSSDSGDSRHNSITADRRRSSSPRDRLHSNERNDARRQRDRRDRSRSKSRDRDFKTRRLAPRSRSRERSGERSRSRELSFERGRSGRVNRNSRDSDALNKPKPGTINPWSVPPIINNSYQIQQSSADSIAAHIVANLSANSNMVAHARAAGVIQPNAAMVAAFNSGHSQDTVLPSFQTYGGNSNTAQNSFSVDLFGVKKNLQNPYTANQPTKHNMHDNMTSSMVQHPGGSKYQQQHEQRDEQQVVAYANSNPYERIYPKLFAQAATITNVPQKDQHAGNFIGDGSDDDSQMKLPTDSGCIKLTNLCGSTTYSDIRKFFTGLFIPHNGIKMVNDQHGVRVGIAFIQFSRVADTHKAMARQNSLLKARPVHIAFVPECEFIKAEDSYRPAGRGSDARRSDGGGEETRGDHRKGLKELPAAFTTLYVEEIPTFATEQDVMKMFSAYTIIDILLMPSRENRRENIAHVRFTRAEEARLALDDRAHHMIGHRKVRVRAGRVEEMEHAKEKLRLANEQLKKEEQALAEEEDLKMKEDEAVQNATVKTEETSLTNGKSDELSIVEDDFVDIVNEVINNSVRVDDDMAEIADDLRARQRQPASRFAGNNNNSNNQSNTNQNQTRSSDNFMRMVSNLNSNNGGNKFQPPQMNDMDGVGGDGGGIDAQSFVLLKNCEYTTRINDIGELFMSSNLTMRHIELLRNDRNLPAGEFIVEFRDAIDADIAIKDFNNSQFRGRSLRMRLITPQEIADRLGKPFMNYFPGSGGGCGGGGGGGGGPPNGPNDMIGARNNDANAGGSVRRRGGRRNRRAMRSGSGAKSNGDDDDMDMDEYSNNEEDNENDSNQADTSNNTNNQYNGRSGDAGDIGDTSIPAKFNRTGCVIAMENVPFRADMKAIMRFFNEFNVTPEDIIRRFNDDGTPTGDARVAFATPEIARNAFEVKRRRHIFNRTIYLRLL